MTHARGRSVLAVLATTTLVLAACGDDDGADTATTAAATTPSTAAATAATTAAASSSQFAEACALAAEMAGQDGFPTHAQVAAYQAVAPPEIADSVAIAAAAITSAPEGDPVNLFKASAADPVEAALQEINEWETANCGIEHDEPSLPPGASHDVESGATRVDVRAEDFTIAVPEVSAGRTSFVLTNHGAEVHHLVIFQLAEGVTFEQAMSAEDSDGMITGTWATGLAFPDGEDEEAITFDVTPGNYGVACFIAGADGNPHAFAHGMTAEFTVA